MLPFEDTELVAVKRRGRMSQIISSVIVGVSLYQCHSKHGLESGLGRSDHEFIGDFLTVTYGFAYVNL